LDTTARLFDEQGDVMLYELDQAKLDYENWMPDNDHDAARVIQDAIEAGVLVLVEVDEDE